MLLWTYSFDLKRAKSYNYSADTSTIANTLSNNKLQTRHHLHCVALWEAISLVRHSKVASTPHTRKALRLHIHKNRQERDLSIWNAQ